MTKQQQLIELIKSYKSVAVAFSGGVDSSALAKACHLALGDKAIAVTAVSSLMTEDEINDAQQVAEQIGIKHEIFHFNDLADAQFTANDKMRCYHCHINRFKFMEEFCRQNNIFYLLEGSNEDDKGDYRPGMTALKEFDRVKSPFLELHISKNEIRQMAKQWNLPVWNKLSSACLASRLAYGIKITPKRLHQVAQAEKIIRPFVQGQMRVRHHGDLARIEVDETQIAKIIRPETIKLIDVELKKLGFKFVTIDLSGYTKGSNNAILK